MERADAIERLPVAYATAMRMLDEGATPTEIAQTIGMALEAVPALVAIGERKLAAILATS